MICVDTKNNTQNAEKFCLGTTLTMSIVEKAGLQVSINSYLHVSKTV